MSDREYLIETMTIDLAKLLLHNGVAGDIQSALDVVYNSDTYEKVCSEGNHLRYQSPGYVYCYLNDELRSGKL
ncbi:MAG: hypothetical protein HUK06_06995 [Bacteroidaceae bacterium]|nr:hypothetical protein [Bacteroidaceae bacterium]